MKILIYNNNENIFYNISPGDIIHKYSDVSDNNKSTEQ